MPCHAIELGSGVFARVHEALIWKAFRSGAFIRNRSGSKGLLTETLTLCSGKLMALRPIPLTRFPLKRQQSQLTRSGLGRTALLTNDSTDDSVN